MPHRVLVPITELHAVEQGVCGWKTLQGSNRNDISYICYQRRFPSEWCSEWTVYNLALRKMKEDAFRVSLSKELKIPHYQGWKKINLTLPPTSLLPSAWLHLTTEPSLMPLSSLSRLMLGDSLDYSSIRQTTWTMPKVRHHPQILHRNYKNNFSVIKTAEGCKDEEWLMTLSEPVENKGTRHLGCWYFLTPQHSHMVATWGTKTTALSQGEKEGLCSLVSCERQHAFREVLP